MTLSRMRFMSFGLAPDMWRVCSPASWAPLDDALLEPDAPADPALAAVLRALQRVSPSAAEFYTSAQDIYAHVDTQPAAVNLLFHMLRELDSTIRDVWWNLTCFGDEGGRQAREEGRREGGKDAPHSRQIAILSRRLGLSTDDETTWQRCRSDPKFAHRGKIGPTRRLNPEQKGFVEQALTLFGRIARATESAYGDAIVRAAAMLDAGPDGQTTKVLSGQFPYHPPLRNWLLAQVDSPVWLRPLHAADMLRPAEALEYQPDGTAVAPTCPGARVVGRLARVTADRELLAGLLDEWLTIRNPRLHTDVVHVLVESPLPLYERYVATLCGWLQTSPEHGDITRLVGDAGVLRFPSHCLRLAARALHDGRDAVAEELACSTSRALADRAPDERSYLRQAGLALLGARPVLDSRSDGVFLKVFESTGRSRRW